MAENNAHTMMATMWSVNILSLLFVISRIFSKCKFGKSIGADDYILVVSWVVLTIYTALTHVATQYGLGFHYVDIAPNDFPLAMKYMTLGELFAILALQTSKTSFAVTLLRVVTKSWQIWALWAIIITNNAVLGIDAILTIASCTPVAKKWRFELPGRCLPTSVVVYFSVFVGIYSGLMDITLATFPMVLLQPLKMKRKEKIGICIAMSLGFFAGVAAFIKSAYLLQLLKWTDPMYSAYLLLVWSATETSITIIAACIPYLRFAFGKNGFRSKGYQVYGEEVNMPRITAGSRTDPLSSSIGSKKRITVTTAVTRHSTLKGDSSLKESAASDSWVESNAEL